MRRHLNKGVRKRCDCHRRNWPKCGHPWWMNFKWKGVHHPYSLDKLLATPPRTKGEAVDVFDIIKMQIKDGTFRAPGVAAPDTPALGRLKVADLFATYRTRYLAVTRAATLRNTDYQIEVITRVMGHASGVWDPDGARLLLDVTVRERGRTVSFVRVSHTRRPPGITGGGLHGYP